MSEHERTDETVATGDDLGHGAGPGPGTEGVDPRYADLDAWSTGRTLAALVGGQRRAIEAVATALPALEAAADGIAARLAGGGRLAYAGAGTSGRLGYLDATELPPTFGFDRTVVLLAGGPEAMAASQEGAEDDEDAARAGVATAGIGPDDALIGVAASGRTPFTVAAVRAARAAGAFTVGVASVGESPLLHAAEVAVWLDTGPEVLAGSTRLAAGTAQKAALNLLSTSVLVSLGGAYGNLMVGMRASNEKLRRRALAMVARAAGGAQAAGAAGGAPAAGPAAGGAPVGAAAEALRAADDDIRAAIVMLRAGVDADGARAALTANGQRVRAALAALGVNSSPP